MQVVDRWHLYHVKTITSKKNNLQNYINKLNNLNMYGQMKVETLFHATPICTQYPTYDETK